MRTTTRSRPPVPPAPARTRTVRIGDPDAPGEVLTLCLRWLCPVPTCRWPRGEPQRQRLAYHDAAGRVIAYAWVDRWRNECGHLQLGHQLVAEAAELAGQQHQAAIPRPRTGRRSHG